MRHRSSSAARVRGPLVLALLAAGLLPFAAVAQTKADASPGGWVQDASPLGVQRLTTPGIDRDWVEIEDMKRFDAGEPVTRFAIAHKNRIAPQQLGTWDSPAPGIKRWRVVLASPEALSINLGFSRFHLPDGAELTLLDRSGKAQFRSFTAADNDDHGQLWTPLVSGDEVTVVLTVPAKVADAVQLEIGSVNHGYRGLGEQAWFTKSGSCNVDVICPEGDAWRDQIRSVAALTLNGIDQCSGALINNVREDLTAYFLTAYHCNFNSAPNAASMVAYWNYENSICRPPGSGASGGNGDGSRLQFNSGAIVRAGRAFTDFALVEFDDPIDPAYNVYWAGFDARDQVTASAVGIHHPGVEEKRISFEDQPTTIASYGSGTNSHLRVADWDLGTTEGGSSGSPLFSPEQRIVGQLHGGTAACGNNLPDFYGRVGMSWDAGGTAATQLRNWLDPDNTGTRVVDGRNRVEAGFGLELDPAAVEVCTITEPTFDVDVSVLQVEAGFVTPVTLAVSGLPANATGSFVPTTVVPGNASVLTLASLDDAAAGSYTVTVEGTDGADVVSADLPLSIADVIPAAATLVAPTNGASGQNTSPTLTWTAVPQATGYRVELADNDDFTAPLFDEVVTNTSVTVPGLSVTTVYYWRVTAQNACGTGTVSVEASFETSAEYCAIPNADIPDNAPTAPLVSTIAIAETAEILDLQVGIELTHTYVGDLIATLSNGTVTIDLINRPGRLPNATTGFGCNGDDADIVLDDAATLTAEDNCTSAASSSTPIAAYTTGGHYRPNAPLSGFDGQSLAGTWTLRVSDNAGGDTGELARWCLQPSTQPIVNDPPQAGTLADAEVLTGNPLNYDAGAAFSDPEDDALTFTLTGLPAWATIDPTTGVITGTPTVADAGVYEVTVTATETSTVEQYDVSAEFTLTVTETNLPPQLVSAIPDTQANVGVLLNFDAGAYFVDPNDDALTFSVTGLPGWASFDPATGIVSGTPSAANIGTVIVTVRATEDHPDGGSIADAFRLQVIDGNLPPVVVTPPDAEITVPVGGALSVDFSDVFDDPDGDALTFSATGLPAWATLDPVTGLLGGTPDADDVGTSTVTVTATENHPDGGSESVTFDLVVGEPVNSGPVLDTPLADVSLAVGDVLAIDAAAAFSDPDGDTLAYSATGLPAWAALDPVTGQISGTPGAGDVGVSNVVVTATEDTGEALSADSEFTLTVTEAPGPLIFADGFEGD